MPLDSPQQPPHHTGKKKKPIIRIAVAQHCFKRSDSNAHSESKTASKCIRIKEQSRGSVKAHTKQRGPVSVNHQRYVTYDAAITGVLLLLDDNGRVRRLLSIRLLLCRVGLRLNRLGLNGLGLSHRVGLRRGNFRLGHSARRKRGGGVPEVRAVRKASDEITKSSDFPCAVLSTGSRLASTRTLQVIAATCSQNNARGVHSGGINKITGFRGQGLPNLRLPMRAAATEKNRDSDSHSSYVQRKHQRAQAPTRSDCRSFVVCQSRSLARSLTRFARQTARAELGTLAQAGEVDGSVSE